MRFLKKLAPFAIILAAAAILLYLPDIGPERYTDLDSFFGTELGRQGYRGYTVTVVANGAVAYTAAFGKDAKGSALEPGSPFLLGEASQVFTGLAALSLAREGVVSLDEPVIDILPWLGSAAGGPAAGGTRMTLRHLLSHSTGISDRAFDDRHLSAPDLETALRGFATARPAEAPGLHETSLQSDYQALALALEERSGVAFDDIVAARIFKPLGMTRSSTRADLVAGALPEGTTSFFGLGLPRSGQIPSFAAGSGYIVSTAEDLGRFLAYLTAPERVARTPVPARALPALFVPTVSASSYSFGWRVHGEGRDVEASRTGALPGCSAGVAVWPGRRAGVAILAPQDSFLLTSVALPSLVEGARSIVMTGSAARPFPVLRLYVLLGITAAVHLLVLILQAGGATGWAHDVRCRSGASGSKGPVIYALVVSWLGVAVRLALLILAPVIAGEAFGSRVDWHLAFTREPGIAAWFMAACVLGALRNIARLAWLGKRG